MLGFLALWDNTRIYAYTCVIITVTTAVLGFCALWDYKYMRYYKLYHCNAVILYFMGKYLCANVCVS
jgi:hypothetical protein